MGFILRCNSSEEKRTANKSNSDCDVSSVKTVILYTFKDVHKRLHDREHRGLSNALECGAVL